MNLLKLDIHLYIIIHKTTWEYIDINLNISVNVNVFILFKFKI